MDDNDDRKNLENDSGTSDTNRSIFSTPELTVDTEKIAQNTKPKTNDQSRVASFFASTDATKNSEILNNSLTPAPVTEDIVINNGQKKRSKVPIVVAIIAILAILAVGSWWAYKHLSTSNSYKRVRTAFLEYANFVLHGEASTADFNDDCASDNSCYFFQKLQSEDEWNDFLAKVTKPAENLANALETWSSTLPKDETTVGSMDSPISQAALVQQLQDLLDLQDFMDIYFSRPNLKKSDIIDYYLQNGEDGIHDYITSYYDFNDNNNPYLANLRDSVDEMSAATLGTINIYAQYSCMTESTINQACFYNSASEEDIAAMTEYDQVITNYGASINTYSNIPDVFIAYIIEINNSFNKLEQVEQE